MADSEVSLSTLEGMSYHKESNEMPSSINITVSNLAALAALCLTSTSAFALCTDGRHFTPVGEMGYSASVLVGRVVGSKDQSDPDDPEGIARTIYTVAVVEVLKGPAPKVLTLTSENTSSRFPMDIGKTYLLYVSSYPDITFIDSCGNSGLLIDRNRACRQVKAALGHAAKR